MPKPPVSLAEVRAHLNFTDTDSHVDDEELWATTVAATGLAEKRFGPIVPRAQTSSVELTRYGTLYLPVQPVLSVQSVTDFDGGEIDVDTLTLEPTGVVCRPRQGIAWSLRFTVEYTVGYDPIPEEIMEAVRLQTGLLWASQRGPAASSRFSALGGDDVRSPSGVDRLRLKDIYDSVGLHLGFA